MNNSSGSEDKEQKMSVEVANTQGGHQNNMHHHQFIPNKQQNHGHYYDDHHHNMEMEGKAQEHISKLEKERSGLEEIESMFTCAICCDPFLNPATLQCGHSFCMLCIEEWFSKKLVCPTCRCPITTLPIKSKCLENAVRTTIESSGDEIAMRRYEARYARSQEIVKTRISLHDRLRNLIQRAGNAKFMQINLNWTEKEKSRFRKGIVSHRGNARVTYCSAVGLTVEWIGSSTPQELYIAVVNVQLPKVDPVVHWNEECVTKLRNRLVMFVRYS